MGIKEFKLPDVGEGVAEGELVAWHVSPGDAVTEDQVVAEVETDKALVDVPSPYDGTVKELLAEEGEVVPVGDVIITFEVEGEGDEEEETAGETESVDEAEPSTDGEETATAETEPESPSGRVFAPPTVRRLARELGVDLADVEGSGPSGRVTESDVRNAAEGGAEADDGETAGPRSVSFSGNSAVSKAGDSGNGRADASASAPSAAGRERTLAAPATRRIADEEGVDIDDVPATEERDGQPFVTEADVRQYAEVQRAAQEADAEALAAEEGAGEAAEPREPAAASAVESEPATGPAAGERVPYRGVRKAIGDQMVRSKYTAPHVTHHDEADVTDLVELREELKLLAAERDVKLTYMPFVTRAVVAALKEYPSMNAQLDEENEEIVLRDEYNVGVATATDAGLLVPVIHGADGMGLLDLARETAESVEKARTRKISPAEMQGGTFTITNVGVIGGEYATPIINYPEVGILALGAIKEKPRVVDGDVVPRKVLTLSLSFDHRVVDGAIAAQFTNEVKEYLETPKLLLLE
jgi:pyruvate dehydrogenase E2 component (dihydrolipoamide acetyltransferase)